MEKKSKGAIHPYVNNDTTRSMNQDNSLTLINDNSYASIINEYESLSPRQKRTSSPLHIHSHHMNKRLTLNLQLIPLRSGKSIEQLQSEHQVHRLKGTKYLKALN